MNSPEVLTRAFQGKLRRQNFPIGDILADLSESSSPIKVLRKWTGLPDNKIREGLFNEERDALSPRINTAILDVVKPWIQTDTVILPTVTVKELSRKTNLSPEKVVSILSKYPLSFSINGSRFVTEIQKPEFPKERLSLKNCSEYGLSPLRVASASRYQSRKPGGGPVQKAGLQDKTVDTVIRKEAWNELEVEFTQVVPEKQRIEYGVMAELEVPTQNATKTIEEIIYSEPEGEKIMQVYRWFKEIGFGKNWVYRGNDVGLAENLVMLSRGKPVDFLIWNCIGFKWFGEVKQLPTCNIVNNLDAAITIFFQSKIKDISRRLSTIGNPKIIILIPSNEAFDSRIWKYRQSYEEREKIINEAVTGLSESFRKLTLPQNVSLSVMRWDGYLASRGAEKCPEEYSREGENRLRQSNNFGKIIQEAVKSGRAYFAQYGITNIPDDIFLARQVGYYGVYAGEGVAFEEIKAKGQRVTIINFEEMRVPQMAFFGAAGNLAIVTPIKNKEMVEYYQWENRQVANRT